MLKFLSAAIVPAFAILLQFALWNPAMAHAKDIQLVQAPAWYAADIDEEAGVSGEGLYDEPSLDDWDASELRATCPTRNKFIFNTVTPLDPEVPFVV